MLSFRIDAAAAAQAQLWADRLGVDRSQLLRDALRQHLVRLAGETDAQTWHDNPLDDGERSVLRETG
jgi:predicted transcriptional regulator